MDEDEASQGQLAGTQDSETDLLTLFCVMLSVSLSRDAALLLFGAKRAARVKNGTTSNEILPAYSSLHNSISSGAPSARHV